MFTFNSFVSKTGTKGVKYAYKNVRSLECSDEFAPCFDEPPLWIYAEDDSLKLPKEIWETVCSYLLLFFCLDSNDLRSRIEAGPGLAGLTKLKKNPEPFVVGTNGRFNILYCHVFDSDRQISHSLKSPDPRLLVPRNTSIPDSICAAEAFEFSEQMNWNPYTCQHSKKLYHRRTITAESLLYTTSLINARTVYSRLAPFSVLCQSVNTDKIRKRYGKHLYSCLAAFNTETPCFQKTLQMFDPSILECGDPWAIRYVFESIFICRSIQKVAEGFEPVNFQSVLCRRMDIHCVPRATGVVNRWFLEIQTLARELRAFNGKCIRFLLNGNRDWAPFGRNGGHLDNDHLDNYDFYSEEKNFVDRFVVEREYSELCKHWLESLLYFKDLMIGVYERIGAANKTKAYMVDYSGFTYNSIAEDFTGYVLPRDVRLMPPSALKRTNHYLGVQVSGCRPKLSLIDYYLPKTIVVHSISELWNLTKKKMKTI